MWGRGRVRSYLARVADAAVEAVLVLGGLALRLGELGARLLELVAQLQA